MAQLLAPVAPDGRISQFLPTVKCSNCNHPVPIHELEDHVCESAPPTPNARTSSLVSPLSAIERNPQQSQQAQVALPAPKVVQAQQAVSTHQVSAHNSNAQQAKVSSTPSQYSRSRAPSVASQKSRNEARPDHGTRPASRNDAPDAHPAYHPPRPGTAETPRVRSPLAGRDASSPSPVPFPSTRSPSLMSRSPTPGQSYSPLQENPDPRSRAPSAASLRPPTTLPGPVRQPTQSSPTPFAPNSAPISNGPPPGPARLRAASNVNARPPDNGGYELIYSTDQRHGPMTAPAHPQSPYNGPDSALLQPQRPRVPSTASLPPALSQRARAPSTASLGPSPQSSHAHGPPNVTGRPPFERRPSNLGAGPSTVPAKPPSPQPSPSPGPVRSPVPDIDTKTGGTAGMAGVGRRGFAAAAHAAMLATTVSQMPGHNQSGHWDHMAPGQGMDGRRANAPKFLDIASALQHSANTPPLSPHSPSSASPHSPHSPYSQKSPVALVASPLSDRHPSTPTNAPTMPVIASSSPIAISGQHILHRDRVLPAALEPPKVPLPPVPATPTTPRLPFFEKFKAAKQPDLQKKDEKAPLKGDEPPSSPTSDAGSEGAQLAYAQPGDDSFDEPLPSPKLLSSEALPEPVPSTASEAGKGKVRFPSMSSQYSSTEPAASPRMPMRSLSALSAPASAHHPLRTLAKSTGALDRVLEDVAMSPVGSAFPDPGPLSAPLPPDTTAHVYRDSKPPKLPMRAHTSPTLNGARLEQTRAKQKERTKRACAKCEKVIEDGRWIQMDGGSVLCDRCWKNLYLPKCRRCNQTIEKAAVSSSDGQLKGKYHKECFNCSKCHAPFPDKTFYVLDGKPFCAYHYHEANDSLCAAPACGQPIEGPCAVSHSGHRYHPEHFTCEYAKCTERLVEYWEVDGRVLCERHAQNVMSEEREPEPAQEDDVERKEAGGEEERRDSTARAMKRVTRFIDLTVLEESEVK